MNPETLPRHELAGLHAEIVDSPNADLVGLSGDVVDETTNTLVVATGTGTKQVPKAAATFRFRLDDCEDSASDARGDEPRTVIVEGTRLVARPARRTEHTGTSKWR